jgi:hemoglobin/transferrin/lactoferrin receptor protein
MAMNSLPGGQRRVMGAFLQAKYSWSIFDIIGAVRYDRYSLDGGTTSLDGARASPKLTLAMTPIKGITVYGTYAEGYRAPAVTETLIAGFHPAPATFRLLPNPNLLPETAHTFEGGVNVKYNAVFQRHDALRAKINVFENKVDDYIGGVFSPLPLPFGQFQYQNIAKVTLRGLEFEAAYDARLWFMGLAAHRIRGTNDITGLPLDTVPADQVSLTGGLRFLDERLTVGSRVRFVAAQDRVTTATLATSSYRVVDLFAEYKHSADFALNLNIDNVFDKDYRQFLDQSNSPGLNARLGATLRFGAK